MPIEYERGIPRAWGNYMADLYTSWKSCPNYFPKFVRFRSGSLTGHRLVLDLKWSSDGLPVWR